MKKYLGNKAMIILFIAPVMLFMIVMVFYPLVVLMRNSFTTWDGLNPATFNGIKNYVRLFKDPLFYTGLKNGIIYAAIQTCYQIPIATLLAFAVKSVSKGEKKFFRIAYYIPAVLSVTVVCQLWVAIYDADYGLINKIFEALGLAYRQNWLSGNDTAIRAIAFVGTWQYAGYQFILLLSAANSVPNDYFEAALLDGCSKPKAHMRITIPLMQEAYKYCLIIAITGGLCGHEHNDRRRTRYGELHADVPDVPLGLCREQVRLRLRRGGAAGRAEPDRLVLRQQVHRARADHLLRWRIWEKSLLSVQSCSGYFFIFMLLSVSIP